jgi:hypothetical protein
MGAVETVLLGQFTDEHADDILAGLEDAGIVHWVKRSGNLVRLLSAADWGVRIFVDRDRSEQAAAIARSVAPG